MQSLIRNHRALVGIVIGLVVVLAIVLLIAYSGGGGHSGGVY